jgi:hypothetical protein
MHRPLAPVGRTNRQVSMLRYVVLTKTVKCVKTLPVLNYVPRHQGVEVFNTVYIRLRIKGRGTRANNSVA